MTTLDFTGHTVNELLGQRDVTMAEVTQIIGKTLHHPELKYVQFLYEEAQKA